MTIKCCIDDNYLSAPPSLVGFVHVQITFVETHSARLDQLLIAVRYFNLIMVLEEREIIQVDSTVIAGALILLTLANIAGDTSHIKNLIGLIAFTILPFGISAVLILCLGLLPTGSPKLRFRGIIRRFSLAATTIGFIILVCALLIYVVFPDLYSWHPFV